MKIFYVALKYNYGDPEKGHSFEHYNFYDSLVKMNNGEHEIVYFPFDEIMNKIGREEMNKSLLYAVYKEKPDLCFFFLFTDEIKKEVIKEITEKSGVITFNWFADDHWRFYNFSRYWAPLFHWTATTDSEAPEKYRKTGYENIIKTQWACNHFLYKPFDLPKKYNVAFVGQTHSNRMMAAEKLKKAGIDIQCWGSGWPNGKISQDEMIKLFSQTKINLNLTMSSWVIGIKPIVKLFFNRRAGGYYQLRNPLSWPANLIALWNSRRNQIKGRTFEIPGCGGFLMTSGADNLKDYYEDGKEVVIFKDIDDLIEKTRYYLKNNKEREQIAKAGYERTLREHTYEKRFNEIFKTIFR